MTKYLLGRLAQVIPTTILVTIVVFLMLHLAPGDPVSVILSAKAVAYTEEDVTELRQQLGLDKPLAMQYLSWAGGALRGDLGTSLYLRREIRPLLLERMSATATLAAGALLFALPVGVLAGVASSLLRGTIWDRLINAVVVMGVALPVFALGLLLIVVFGANLRWLPVSGMSGIGGGDLIDRLKHLVLPAIALGVGPAAILARLTRSAMLEVQSEDYVRTARAKGLKEWVVLVRHALRAALIPIVSLVGIFAISLIGSSVLVEEVFARPGLGKLMVGATKQKDYTTLQSIMVVYAMIIVIINLVTDIIYTYVDPRVRYS